MAPPFPPICESVTITTDAFRLESQPTRQEAATSEDHRSPSLVEVVAQEAVSFRARGTPAGAFLARQMERLAQLLRWTGAKSPDDHEARMDVWDEEIREQWFDRGYHEGYEAGRRDALRALRARES